MREKSFVCRNRSQDISKIPSFASEDEIKEWIVSILDIQCNSLILDRSKRTGRVPLTRQTFEKLLELFDNRYQSERSFRGLNVRIAV